MPRPEAVGQQFYQELQDFLELTLQKDVLVIIGDWNAKVGNQEIPERYLEPGGLFPTMHGRVTAPSC